MSRETAFPTRLRMPRKDSDQFASPRGLIKSLCFPPEDALDPWLHEPTICPKKIDKTARIHSLILVFAGHTRNRRKCYASAQTLMTFL